MCTYSLPNFLHKVRAVRLTGGFLEGGGISYRLYVGRQGVSEVGENFWIGIGSFFIVDQLGCKNICFWKNGLDERNGHRCEEGNEAKYLWYAISILVFF